MATAPYRYVFFIARSLRKRAGSPREAGVRPPRQRHHPRPREWRSSGLLLLMINQLQLKTRVFPPPPKGGGCQCTHQELRAHPFGAAERNDVIGAQRLPPATGEPETVDLRGAEKGGGGREDGSSGTRQGLRTRAHTPPPSPTHIGPVGRPLVHQQAAVVGPDEDVRVLKPHGSINKEWRPRTAPHRCCRSDRRTLAGERRGR